MPFNLITTNPPYNKGTVKHFHKVYKHEAMNAGREGTVGFLIEQLSHLADNGSLSFITPIKFLRGPGCTKTRQFLFKNYKLISVRMKDPKIFKGIGVDKIGVTSWTTGVTDQIDVDGVIIDPYKMPDLIVPAFESQSIADQYVKDIQNGLLGRPIGGPKPANNKFRIVFAKTFMRGFRIEQPGYALGFYENCYEKDNQEDANDLIDHLNQMVFSKRWSSIGSARDSHCISRYLPYYHPIDVSRHTDTTTRYLPKG